MVYLQSFTVYTLSQSRLGMGGGGGLHILCNFSLCCTSSWPGLRVGHLVSQSSRSRLGEHVLWFRTLSEKDEVV